jgi:Domain of unknown function (DUF6268)
MKKAKFIILLLFLVINAYSQKYVDIVKFYNNGSALNYFENSDSSTRIKELGIDITLPILLNPSDAFLTGLIYERTQTKLFESEPEETFSILGIRAGLSKKHSDKWSGTYILIPKFASDFEGITSKDFQLGAIVLLKYNKRENLNYKLGAYYNSEFFGPIFVPLFGLYYLSSDKKFETNLTLPFMADANYKLHDRVNIGVNFSGLVRSYHLSQIPEGNNEGYVVKASNELFSYLKFNLSKELSIQTKLGYSVGRSYRVYDESDKITFGSILIRVGDDRQQLNTDFANGWVYQATLLYRFMQD